MPELAQEAWGPTGDASRHLRAEELEEGLLELPAPPRDEGRLALIVRRRADGVRETPDAARLDTDEGLPGDGWSRRPPRKHEAQLAVMCQPVAELVANGQPLSLFGDNLFVDLDLSAANLPVGTRLAVGEAVAMMTAEPHDGCLKFKQRFGQGALRFVQAKATRQENRRGVYWKVVESGEVRIGCPVRVLARGGDS